MINVISNGKHDKTLRPTGIYKQALTFVLPILIVFLLLWNCCLLLINVILLVSRGESLNKHTTLYTPCAVHIDGFFCDAHSIERAYDCMWFKSFIDLMFNGLKNLFSAQPAEGTRGCRGLILASKAGQVWGSLSRFTLWVGTMTTVADALDFAFILYTPIPGRSRVITWYVSMLPQELREENL